MKRAVPSDFMFVLSDEELSKWRSQFVTSNADRIRRKNPNRNLAPNLNLTNREDYDYD